MGDQISPSSRKLESLDFRSWTVAVETLWVQLYRIIQGLGSPGLYLPQSSQFCMLGFCQLSISKHLDLVRGSQVGDRWGGSTESEARAQKWGIEAATQMA